MVRKYVADTDFTENEDDMTGRGRMRKKTCIKILKNSHSSNLSSSEEEEDRGNSPPHKWKKVVLNSSMQSTRETMDPLQERSGDPLPARQGSVNSLHPIQEPVQAIDLENIPIEFLNTLSPSIRSFIATPVSSVSSFSAAASKDDIIYSKIFSVCSHIKLAVENISERLKKIEEGSPLAMDDDTGEIEQLLPLNSKESLDSFEIFLSDDFNIQKIRSFIKRIGGRDGKDLLIRLLKRCFTNELAIKCSWLGQRNNIKVCDLKLIRLIKGVVTSQFKDYKEHALDAAASDWFRHAKLRFSREKLERKP